MFDYSQVTGGSALKSPTVGKKGEDGSAITAFGGTPPVNLDVAEDAIAHPEPPLLRYLHTFDGKGGGLFLSNGECANPFPEN